MPSASVTRIIPWVAAAVFSALWLFLSQTLPIWSEGVSVYPAPGASVIASVAPGADAEVRMEASCADANAPRLVLSESRPLVSVCFAGRQYPLLITNYASGVPYWISDVFLPLHRGRVFLVTTSGLVLGLLALWLAHRLVGRFADAATADAATLCTAVMPAFVFLYSTPMHYEVVPWLACAAAVDRISAHRNTFPALVADGAGSGLERLPTRTVVAVAALFGLAVISNIKALFLIVPLGVMVLRSGDRTLRLERHQQLIGALVFAIALSPLIIGNVVAHGAIGGEALRRFDILLGNFSLQHVALEVVNLAAFWSDMLFYLVLASGERAFPAFPAMIIALPALGYCLWCGIAYAWRGRGRVVPATCGLLFLTSIVVSALLYNQFPSANHSPLAAAFGIATAVAVMDGSRAFATRFGRSQTLVPTLALSVTAACFLWSSLARGNPAHFASMSFNVRAVRDMGNYLEAQAASETPLVVTTYALAGIPEAVTGGAVRGIQAQHFLDCIGNFHGEQPEDCLPARFQRLLAAFPGPIRLLVPVRAVPVDERFVGGLGAALESAAAASGRAWRDEALFSGRNTPPLLRLVRVEAAQ